MNKLFTMKMPGDRLKIGITPGIMFPNWPVVTSAKAADALGAFQKAFGAERRWAEITPEKTASGGLFLRNTWRRLPAPEGGWPARQLLTITHGKILIVNK
jgi:hypothetical protein